MDEAQRLKLSQAMASILTRYRVCNAESVAEVHSRKIQSAIREAVKAGGNAGQVRRIVKLYALRSLFQCPELKDAGAGAFVVAFDLDDSALQFPNELVPIAKAVKATGGNIGVITGNKTGDARKQWDSYGYPEPDFWAIHPDDEPVGSYDTFKVDCVIKYGVDLMIDDFRRGATAQLYATAAGSHLGLQVLVPPGFPIQEVGSREVAAIDKPEVERCVEKFAVPDVMRDRVLNLMRARLAPDEHDPDFLGQVIETTYFDTESMALYNVKSQTAKIEQPYVTIRVRHYVPTNDWHLEAKVHGGKFIVDLEPDMGAALAKSESPRSLVESEIPEVWLVLKQLIGSDDLTVRVPMTFKRWACELGDLRATLDVDIVSGEASFPEPMLEVKAESGHYSWPELCDLDLARFDMSKFVWAVEANRTPAVAI